MGPEDSFFQSIMIKSIGILVIAVGSAFGKRPHRDRLRQIERQRLFIQQIAAGAAATTRIGSRCRRRQNYDRKDRGH